MSRLTRQTRPCDAPAKAGEESYSHVASAAKSEEVDQERSHAMQATSKVLCELSADPRKVRGSTLVTKYIIVNGSSGRPRVRKRVFHLGRQLTTSREPWCATPREAIN